MASSLFNNQRPQGQPQKSNLISQFNQFQKMMNGRDPRQMVQNLMDSGQMSQQQFEALSRQASSMMNGFRK